MNDPVYAAFLDQQAADAAELAQQSDLLEVIRGGPDRFLARFKCKGLVRAGDGQITEASDFEVGIWFPRNYLRHVEPYLTLTWLLPLNVWHPNILPPAICVGRITPGTELVDLLYQVYEIITYFNWASHDALNRDAAQWARNQPKDLFPVDRRPLKRRALAVQVRSEEPPS